MNATIAAVLWFCSITDGGGRYCDAHPMPSMQDCYNAVSNAQFSTPNGGDMQTSAVMFCTPSLDTYSNGSDGNLYHREIKTP